MTKLTKKDKFTMLLELSEVKSNETLVDFINHELELLNRKTGGGDRKKTPVQIANDSFKEAILDGMTAGRKYTISELQKEIPAIASAELSNQRVSALVRQLKEDKLVERVEEKGKAYFSKVC